jgi:hypothetical protein
LEFGQDANITRFLHPAEWRISEQGRDLSGNTLVEETMTPELAFECLFISRDPTLYSTIDRVLWNLSITVDHCLRPSEASQVIVKGTHDLVVIEWEGDESSSLIRTIWNLPKKKKPTTMVISDEVAVPGGHVTLRKPVTLESGTQSLKTAYARMLLDHRIHARHAVMTNAIANYANGEPFPITVTDISEGGVGIKNSMQIAVGTVLWLKVPLRDAPMPLHLQTRIVWTRGYGTAGCEIVDMPPVDRGVFRDWLKARTRVKKPLIPL